MERLTALLSMDLLTEADLDGFSPGVRVIAVKMGAIVRMPREIVTRDPDTDEELPPPRVLVVSGREVEVRVVTDLPNPGTSLCRLAQRKFRPTQRDLPADRRSLSCSLSHAVEKLTNDLGLIATTEQRHVGHWRFDQWRGTRSSVGPR